jgi:hypothetical protein
MIPEFLCRISRKGFTSLAKIQLLARMLLAFAHMLSHVFQTVAGVIAVRTLIRFGTSVQPHVSSEVGACAAFVGAIIAGIILFTTVR